MTSFEVIKFGGSSVTNLACWNNIKAILQPRLNPNNIIIMVCSAPSQISNLLQQALQSALTHQHQDSLQHIKSIYQTLTNALGIQADDILQSHFQNLEEKLLGIALLEESSPRIQAQIMAFGELLLSRLGAIYLNQNGIDTAWLDARTKLKALTQSEDPYQHYLSSTCDANPDFAWQQQLAAAGTGVVITQGFIASNQYNDTVLLGRGGSDTSAAYFSALVEAKCCEIWTDVPGIYTADPKIIPSARMLQTLGYDEAQEIAALGGKVLHPQCLTPLAARRIPLSIKFTQQPDRIGTTICMQDSNSDTQIKALSLRRAVRLISIDTVRMWQQVGFLADVFSCFKKHHLSIDLVSTSESNLTVSLDNTHSSRDQHTIDRALQELNQYGDARVIGPCAAISIIGRNMRSNLPKLSQVLDIFKDKQVHLLAQAANDLNLTFVVDESEAERLLKKMHHQLIDTTALACVAEQTWSQEFGDRQHASPAWWQQNRATLLALAQDQKPHYVYNINTVRQRAESLQQCDNIDRIYYSIKANHRLEILRVIVQQGIGLECVSLQELQYVIENFNDLDRDRILFTPNFACKDEYITAFKHQVLVTVDNLYPLLAWPEVFKDHSILVRIDCGEGAGHHRYVHTAGSDSKFGIPQSRVKELKQAVTACQTRVIGYHTHSGSGILSPNNWQQNATALSQLLGEFPDANILDLGGGLGVVEKPGQRPLDLVALNHSLTDIKVTHPSLQLWLEPGRFLSAEAGVLLAHVTQTKTKGNHHYVGINTGMNALIRPALYGAYHHIVNLSKLDHPATTVTTVVGPICESADVLGASRWLPECEEGDVILIATVGAYGEVMSSNYNMRPCPQVDIIDLGPQPQ